MSDEQKDINENNLDDLNRPDIEPETDTSYKMIAENGDTKLHLSGMYRSWFLEYAS